MWWKIFSVIFFVLLIILLLSFFGGKAHSVYVSKDNGSLMYRESIAFPIQLKSRMEFFKSDEVRDTAYSRFLGRSTNSESDNKWVLAMIKIDGLFFNITPTPNMNLRFPIKEANEELLYDFLVSEEKRMKLFGRN